MKLPKARTIEIVEQNLGNELLIYDLTAHRTYTLNETLKIVFRACDGKTSFDDLKRENKFTDEIIYLALDELRKHQLVEDAGDLSLTRMKRREIIRKIGLTAVISPPVISSIVAPTAAHAASGNPAALGASCVRPSDCQSRNCGFTFGAGPPFVTPGSPAVYIDCPPVTSPGPPVNVGYPGYPLYYPGPPVTTACPPVLVTPATPPTSIPGPSTILYVCQQ